MCPQLRSFVVALTAILTLGMGWPASGSASERSRTACATHREYVAQDEHARVWVKHGYYLFACAFGRTHSYQVGPWTEGASPEASVGTWPIVLAGVTIAYCRYEDYFGEHVERNSFTVRNLRTGRVTYRSDERTDDIVLKPDGAAAWTTKTFADGPVTVVHVEDSHGVRVVATGRTITAGSLAVAEDTLYWNEAGVPHSAAIY